LKKVSKHVKTGQPIPDDLLQKKIASQNQNVATMTLNQIFLASVDLILNSAYDKDMIKKQKLIQEENDKKIAEAKKHGQSLV
jgi:Zn-dependent oligopeptidase